MLYTFVWVHIIGCSRRCRGSLQDRQSFRCVKRHFFPSWLRHSLGAESADLCALSSSNEKVNNIHAAFACLEFTLEGDSHPLPLTRTVTPQHTHIRAMKGKLFTLLFSTSHVHLYHGGHTQVCVPHVTYSCSTRSLDKEKKKRERWRGIHALHFLLFLNTPLYPHLFLYTVLLILLPVCGVFYLLTISCAKEGIATPVSFEGGPYSVCGIASQE